MTGLRLNNNEHDAVNISTAFQSSVREGWERVEKLWQIPTFPT